MKINKIVIVLLIIFSLQCAVFSSEIKQANGEKLINKSDEIINSLREKLKEKSNDLLVLADMLKTYSQGGKEVWNKNIISFSEEMKEYGVIRLIDRRGREIIKVVNGIKTEDLKDESTKDYFKTAMKSKVGQVYISPVLISDIFQKPIIRFATPLVNLAEINKAVLEFDMDLDEIINMINSVKIGISGNSYLISLDGTFITNKEKNRIMRENINKNAGPGFEGIFKKMSNFEKGWGECVYNKESCSIGYAPFQEMGWIAVVIIPRQEFEQNELEIKNISASSVYAGEDSQKLSVKSSEQNLSVVSSSTIDTQEAISSTTLKLLDGSLRTKNIDSYKAILTFTKKMADNSFYNFKINIMAKEASGSDYTAFFQRNRNRITGLFELDESVYRKIKFEIVSPSLLKKSKIINQNLVMMYLPVKNEIIRMNRDELGEYESIFEDKEKKYLNSYTSVELKEFTNDRFDIKIDENGTIYMIEMKFKKAMLAENELLKKLKLWVRGDYFIPVKYEWLNERDEVIVSIAYDNIEINTQIEDNQFVINPPAEVIVKDYEQLKGAFLEESKAIKPSAQIDPDAIVQFTYKEIREILQEEISLRAGNIAESLTIASMDYISTADYVKLLNQVNIALKNKDIMYIMILAENGEKVLFKSQPDFDGFNLDNPNNLKIKEISHPILVKERIVGSVRIGLGLSRIDDLLKSKLKQNSSSKTGSKTINKK